ncbi:sirohydrochlorin chelatase [Alkalihalobacillus sp. LMS39]|uniref:sirohydrochlorin chelatase n=1 Tax=Alkalihalobacillus sp. LMS39 TaxID=2924032 RepID=UPI001FB40386|nr:sirohydrochlorin chelatase [Alkalihalobacillus sp. LMS39]UOE95990.1 sirohydrochlorin chelatase [Alkalihalobacillus sp. LMS39]
MQAVLYIGHGTRIKEGVTQFELFIEKVKAAVDVPIQHHSFIELAEPNIEDGIAACVEQGATSIAVIPVLLLAAGHAKLDIPEEIDKAKVKFPTVSIQYGRVIGIDKRMTDMVVDRLVQQGLPLHADEQSQQQTAVLLVGRGSSDPDANSDLAKLARLIWESAPVDHVETCYLAATKPTFDQGLERVQYLPHNKVYVIPYLLFTGILLKQMDAKITKLNEKLTTKDIVLCDYLGYHPDLINVIKDRVKETIANEVPVNCDACKYRMAISS